MFAGDELVSKSYLETAIQEEMCFEPSITTQQTLGEMLRQVVAYLWTDNRKSSADDSKLIV